MDIQLRVFGQDLAARLAQDVASAELSFPATLGSVPVTWSVTAQPAACRPQDLLCAPAQPRVVVVEAHDSAAVEQIRALEDAVHAHIKRQPDLPQVLCPAILVFQSPAILMASADFPDIVSDWMFLPVAVSDLSRRVAAALRRKGMLKAPQRGEAQGDRILSEREVQILQLANGGLPNSQLAQRLFLSETTIKWHLRNIYTKFNVNSRTAALARAREWGLIA